MRSTRGYTLIECITYIAVLLLLLNAAFASYYRCELNAANLRRNADDILRALHAGERWRADIRATIAMPRLTPGGVIIPRRHRVAANGAQSSRRS
jgi:Tfp pilus assembly protein PilE